MSGCSFLRPCVAVCALAAFAGAQDPAKRAVALVRTLSTEDTRAWQGAMDELVRVGEAAVPSLLAELQRQDGDAGAHNAAIRVLGRIGRPAASAVPHLVDEFAGAGDTEKIAIAIALCELGPYARDHAETTRAAMMSEVFRVRGSHDAREIMLLTVGNIPTDVVRAHGRTYLDPDSGESAVVAAFQHENPFVREFAAELLGQRMDTSETIVAALAAAVTEPHPKQVTCTTDGAAGEIEYAVDLDRRIRRLAARALVQRAGDDPRSVPAHVILLDRGNRDQQRSSAHALGAMGAEAAAAVPALCLALEAGMPSVQREAAITLGAIGPAAREAAPALRRAAKSRNAKLAALAANALENLETK